MLESEFNSMMKGKFMIDIIEITIPLEPWAQMRARHRVIIPKDKKKDPFAHEYTDPKQTARATTLEKFIEPYCPKELWSGPISLEVMAYFKSPEKMPTWKERIFNLIWPTKKPDLDNVIKMIKDVMTGMIYRDDNQICSLFAMKDFGDPRWEIKIEKLVGYRHDIKKDDLIGLS